MRKKSLLTASLLLPAALSFGAGFQLNLQGLRQLAMGGGGSAWVWDASTIFYNPAGLSQMNGAQAYVSVLAINPRTQYVSSSNGGGRVDAEKQVFTPFNVYVGGNLKNSRVGVGLGIYTPFGSGLKWDDNWTGRYVIQSISLQSIFVQPTISYRITDAVSIGGGFIYAFGNFKITQALPTTDVNGNDGQATLKGRANGIGYNLGLHIKASNSVQIGVNYRSRVNMKVDNGDATFRVPASVASSFPDTKVSTELPLPDVLSGGIAVKISPCFTVTADVSYVGWQSFDSLKFDFDKTTDKLHNQHAPRKYNNTMIYRLGFNIKASDKLSLMIGGALDPTPVHDGYVSPDLPDADHKVLTGGLSFKASSRCTILAAIEYVSTDKRNATYGPANFSGTYQTKAVTPGIGITYNF